LFNALAGASRAIVTDVPGTTRDLVTETVDLAGLRVTLVDTAGLREAGDVVESEGIARARQAAAVADLVLLVVDRSASIDSETLGIGGPERPHDKFNGTKTILVASKADLPPAWSIPEAIAVSAATGCGLDALKRQIIERLDVESLTDRPEITNVRHINLVERARDALLRAKLALGDGCGLPEEFVLADLQEARAAFEEITGRRTPDDVLAHIFERFCIGK
jgi:tRNA modification GTPase